MATEKQIAANRANAQKSTGPRTPAGRAAVAHNALRHGLRAESLVIPGENADEFAAFRLAFIDSLNPAGPFESLFANRLATLAWRLNRAQGFETAALDKLIEAHQPSDTPADPDRALGRALLDDFTGKNLLLNLSLYETRIQNAFFRALKVFRSLQSQGDRRPDRDDFFLNEQTQFDDSPPPAAPGEDDRNEQTQSSEAPLDLPPRFEPDESAQTPAAPEDTPAASAPEPVTFQDFCRPSPAAPQIADFDARVVRLLETDQWDIINSIPRHRFTPDQLRLLQIFFRRRYPLRQSSVSDHSAPLNKQTQFTPDTRRSGSPAALTPASRPLSYPAAVPSILPRAG